MLYQLSYSRLRRQNYRRDGRLSTITHLLSQSPRTSERTFQLLPVAIGCHSRRSPGMGPIPSGALRAWERPAGSRPGTCVTA